MNFLFATSYNFMSEVELMPRKDREKKSKFQLSQVIVNEPKIEMTGNREIIIDGCKGVVEYSENLIKLNLGETVLALSGDGLVINSFDNSIVVITGQISDISFTS